MRGLIDQHFTPESIRTWSSKERHEFQSGHSPWSVAHQHDVRDDQFAKKATNREYANTAARSILATRNAVDAVRGDFVAEEGQRNLHTLLGEFQAKADNHLTQIGNALNAENPSNSTLKDPAVTAAVNFGQRMGLANTPELNIEYTIQQTRIAWQDISGHAFGHETTPADRITAKNFTHGDNAPDKTTALFCNLADQVNTTIQDLDTIQGGINRLAENDPARTTLLNLAKDKLEVLNSSIEHLKFITMNNIGVVGLHQFVEKYPHYQELSQALNGVAEGLTIHNTALKQDGVDFVDDGRHFAVATNTVLPELNAGVNDEEFRGAMRTFLDRRLSHPKFSYISKTLQRGEKFSPAGDHEKEVKLTLPGGQTQRAVRTEVRLNNCTMDDVRSYVQKINADRYEKGLEPVGVKFGDDYSNTERAAKSAANGFTMLLLIATSPLLIIPGFSFIFCAIADTIKSAPEPNSIRFETPESGEAGKNLEVELFKGLNKHIEERQEARQEAAEEIEMEQPEDEEDDDENDDASSVDTSPSTSESGSESGSFHSNIDGSAAAPIPPGSKAPLLSHPPVSPSSSLTAANLAQHTAAHGGQANFKEKTKNAQSGSSHSWRAQSEVKQAKKQPTSRYGRHRPSFTSQAGKANQNPSQADGAGSAVELTTPNGPGSR